MVFTFFRFNTGIYEQDIIYLGGSIQYTGNILLSSKRSLLEEAVVSISGNSCHVVMERFKDGTAVIYDYISNGVINKKELALDARSFENAFYDAMDKDARFMSYSFFRRLKQYATLLAQLFCAFVVVFGIWAIFVYGFAWAVLLMMCMAIILFFILSRLYSFYRCQQISEHTSFLLTKDCHDDTDDFWNIDKDK